MDDMSESSDVLGYTYDNAGDYARRQLHLLGEILDGHSKQLFEAIPIEEGWRVLDIGSGGGGTVHMLGRQVGDSGSVTAIDLDPRHVANAPNVEIRAGDIRTEQLPGSHYDLIHARLLLMHIPTREQVLRRLIQALRPGGYLVVSDWDCTWRDWIIQSPNPSMAASFQAMQNAMLSLMERNGADLGWARRVPAAMRAAGLSDIRATTFNRVFSGSEAGALLQHNNTYQLRDALLSQGITMEQLNDVRAAMVHQETMLYTYLMFSSVGRRPGEGGRD